LAYVGKGSMVGTIITTPKLWDIAAGVLIAETAGAVVTDWDGNKIFPVDLDSYNGQPLKTLAAGKKTYVEILNLLK
jgi:fructose-1,6-bisphosphatase/inositol monophosphatase family enzyme